MILPTVGFKIQGNHGYDLFYSFESGAVLYRAAQLGFGVHQLSVTFSGVAKVAASEALFNSGSARFAHRWLATKLRGVFEGIGECDY